MSQQLVRGYFKEVAHRLDMWPFNSTSARASFTSIVSSRLQAPLTEEWRSYCNHPATSALHRGNSESSEEPSGKRQRIDALRGMEGEEEEDEEKSEDSDSEDDADPLEVMFGVAEVSAMRCCVVLCVASPPMSDDNNCVSLYVFYV